MNFWTNIYPCSSYTPLHLAARYGHFEVCKLILDNIDDIDTETSDEKQTPYDWAKNARNLEICKLIESYRLKNM